MNRHAGPNGTRTTCRKRHKDNLSFLGWACFPNSPSSILDTMVYTWIKFFFVSGVRKKVPVSYKKSCCAIIKYEVLFWTKRTFFGTPDTNLKGEGRGGCWRGERCIPSKDCSLEFPGWCRIATCQEWRKPCSSDPALPPFFGKKKKRENNNHGKRKRISHFMCRSSVINRRDNIEKVKKL